jgi:hypothetical protein
MVVLSFDKHPVSSFGQMPGQGDHCASMPFIGLQAPIQIAHVPVARAAQAHGATGRFDEGPFEIQMHEARSAAQSGMAAGREHAQSQAAIAGQPFGGSEPADITGF